ncbi:MAG: peptide deformylase [Bacteroidetes bacterium]|jgi:peptide deformylase|nr:peptide deformylase [Bacteroidota bacterium]
MALPIILYGSTVLRKHCFEVKEEDNLKEISDELFDTLKKARGIGLAAPQINLLKRIFVIDTTPMVKDDVSIEQFEGVYLNPEILDYEKDSVTYTEGCLSIPDIFEEVKRPDKIYVRYQDISLKTHEEELDGIIARIFQHEYDHLEGILFIDRMNLLKRKLIAGKLNNIKRSSIT